MFPGSSALRFSVPLGSWLGLFLAASTAHAHRLIVECHVLPSGKVQVESWFDLSGASPKSAKVQVFRAGDQLLTEGRLDDNGIFVFFPERPEPLRVVVSAGDGHQTERTISAESIARSLAGNSIPTKSEQKSENPTAPVPLSDRSSRVSVTDVLAGVGFVLALAAFVMSWRNGRRLRSMSKNELPGDLGRKQIAE